MDASREGLTMPSQEFTGARVLLDELESHWISLLLWLAERSGLTPAVLVAESGDLGIDALTEFQAALLKFEKRRAQTPSASFTPLHFLGFPQYVELVTANANRFAAFGSPPVGWAKRLRRQNESLITFRNDLQHAGRFDLLPPADRKRAVHLFTEQLQDVKAWWPEHVHQQQTPLLEENPLRAAVQMVTRDETSATALAEALGFSRVRNPVVLNPPGDPSQLALALGGDVGRLYRVGEKSISGGAALVSVGLYVAYLREWPPRSAAREKYRRRLARALTEDTRDARFLIVMIDDRDDRVDAEQTEIEIVFSRTKANRPFGTVRAVIDLARPTRYHLDLLRDLNISRCTSLAEVARRWGEAFNVERVTNAFYKEFQSLRNALADGLILHNQDHPEIAGWTPADLSAANPTPRQREFKLNVNAFATRQLSRLLFLWFLQEKGWLGAEIVPGPRTFLVDLYRARPKTPNSYFSERLAPLFFDALGESAGSERHIDAEAALGGVRIPYLDGGLFRPDSDPFERKLFGIDETGGRTRAVILPDDLFDPAKDNPDAPAGRRGAQRQRTVLGLLRSYRFTTQESTPDDQSVDPDPELLGKVFENLYQETDRHETGAYYTPREIVRYMCRQTLDGHLRGRTGVEQSVLDTLRREAIDWQETNLRLSAADEDRLTRALDEVTVIDPAVGSGAFLVGMLQEIVLLRRGIRSAATDREVDRASDDVFKWKERAITHSLHGVDINPAAVEICRLRLWLSLVIEYAVERIRDIPPLPNLEFRVVAGDSLIDRAGETALVQSLQAEGKGSQLGLESQADGRELDRLMLAYNAASAGQHIAAVGRLGREIRELQRQIAEKQLRAAIARARADESGVRALPRLNQAAVNRAVSRVGALTALLDGLKPDAPFLKPLLWPLVFPLVFQTGGFDIVVANPPYVRQESLDAIDQEAFKAAFPDAFAGTADLYVFFFARALQLLREGGWLAFITSNKYMRASYGAKLRADLPKRIQIERVIDFGDLPVFSVAAYPAVLIGKKTAAPDAARAVTVADLTVPIRRALKDEGATVNLEGVRGALEDVDGLVAAARPADYPQALLRGGGWILEDPVLIRLFDRLMNEGTPLGRYVDGRIYYGIKTGFNEAFVIDGAKRDELIAADPASADLIKPWLRGRDIRRWRAEWAGLHLIAIQNSGDRDAANPWAASPSEAAARAIFAKTYPALHDHLSQYEANLRPRADQGRFWWELRACAYYGLLKLPKVMWPDIAKLPRFMWDDEGFFSSNTSYLTPFLRQAHVVLLNSIVADFAMSVLSPALQGGYRRYFTQYLEGMPLPRLLSEESESALMGFSESHDETRIDEAAFAAYRINSSEQRALRDFRDRLIVTLDESDELAPNNGD